MLGALEADDAIRELTTFEATMTRAVLMILAGEGNRSLAEVSAVCAGAPDPVKLGWLDHLSALSARRPQWAEPLRVLQIAMVSCV